MRVTGKEIFIESPGPGTLIWGNSWYTRAAGQEKMRTRAVETRSDIIDTLDYSFSTDNGRSWSEWQPERVVEKTENGVYRRLAAGTFADPETDRLVTLVLEGLFPTDDPLDGMRNYFLSYRVSTDGGRSSVTSEQIIGDGGTGERPFDCVYVGHNCLMAGGGPFLRSRTSGKMLFPVMITPQGPDGEYCNPGGGYTWTEAVVLIGEWRPDLTIAWELSERVALRPDQSTRGAIEPTIAEMPDGRILMVLRASNDAQPDLPACKWYSVSTDGGRHWSEPEQWGYSDGDGFYSPSSISQLITHSNGKTYWFGNITGAKPRGNSPRYPLVAGEVDPVTLRLKKETLSVIDDLRPGEDSSLQLSNFSVHEDRETGDLLLHLSRFFTNNWFGDAELWRIRPEWNQR